MSVEIYKLIFGIEPFADIRNIFCFNEFHPEMLPSMNTYEPLCVVCIGFVAHMELNSYENWEAFEVDLEIVWTQV